MAFVASSWNPPRQTETLLATDGERFTHSHFGSASDEVVVADERSAMTPSQAVENRLIALLRESSVPVSHLQIRGLVVRGRRDD